MIQYAGDLFRAVTIERPENRGAAGLSPGGALQQHRGKYIYEISNISVIHAKIASRLFNLTKRKTNKKTDVLALY
jgi:hypothetical protein